MKLVGRPDLIELDGQGAWKWVEGTTMGFWKNQITKLSIRSLLQITVAIEP